MCFSVHETHEVAEAQQEKNAKLREAFGISEYFVEGSSLDPERLAKEAAAKAAAAAAKPAKSTEPADKKYALVRTPSPEPSRAELDKADRKKKRKRDGWVELERHSCARNPLPPSDAVRKFSLEDFFSSVLSQFKDITPLETWNLSI